MRLHHALSVAVLAAACLGMSLSARAQVPDKDTKTPKTEKTEATKDAKDLEALTKTVESLKAELGAAKKALDATKKDIGDLGAKVSKVGESATEAKAAVTTGVAKVDAAAKSIADMEKTLGDGKKGMEESLKGLETVKTEAGTAATLAKDGIARGDTAWMLIATALVMLMIPGLALFYGGMVRRKNVLATMMQSLACLSIVGLYWVAFGYGLAFGPSVYTVSALGVEDGGIIGWSWKLFFLQDVGVNETLLGYNIPVYLHVLFQGMFAIITPALISGAVAERIRFWPFCIFCILWITVVYCPLAHMVWAFDWFNDVPLDKAKGLGMSAAGFLGKMGALDFAGGTVVHIAAGFAGLAACLFMRRRTGYPKTVVHPNSMVITLLGAGLLWFGWFGFNGGSSLMSNGLAVSAFAATQAAAAAAGLSWIVVEWVMKGKPTALGLASGIVAGLVAVTPASGFVYIWGGAAIGALAGILCYFAVAFKNMLGYDDSLDAFGVHGVGGFLGAVLTGIFCYTAVNSVGTDGYFAMTGQKARIEMLEKTGIADAEKEAKTATANFEKIKAEYDALVAKGEDKLDDKEKASLVEFKYLEATAKSKTDGIETLKKELTTLKETVSKQVKDEKTPFTQTMIQLKASTISAVFAFVVSALLVLLVQVLTLGNFTTTVRDETTGLDQTEHGEAGFDFGLATEAAPTHLMEPKSATMPKTKINRFELVVEGVPADDVVRLWTGLCQPSEKPVSPDFLVVYPAVTTFSGNKFRCRGSDSTVIATRLESLFKKLLPGKPVKVVKL